MKKAVFAFLFLCGALLAQTPGASPITNPHVTFVNSNGQPCWGCTFFSYAAGTSTPLATYKDENHTIANQNPLSLGFTGGADVWMLANTSYRLRLVGANNAVVWDIDNVTAGGGGGGGAAFTPTGIQYATSTTAATVATSTQIQSAIGGGVYDASGAAAAAQSASVPLSPISGALADYLSVSGSGTTLTDISGNGNNGTFATLAPTWGSNGLNFSVGQGVSLPSTLNTARTQIIAVWVKSLDFPVTAGASTNIGTYQALITSATANQDNFTYSLYENGSMQGARSLFSPSTYTNNAYGTACTAAVAGFHIFARTTGTNSSTDPDHMYVDGVECQSYITKTASNSFQASVGNYYIGSPLTGIFSGTSGLTGTVYRTVFLSAESTAAQILSYSNQIRSSLASLGVAMTSPPAVMGNPQLLAGVDSLTYGYDTATPATMNWAANLVLTNQPTYTITNYGVVGSWMLANAAASATRESTICKSSRGPSVSVIFGGTNDISGGFTPAETFAALASMVKTEKAAGCVVGVGTMISHTGYDASKDTYDALILTNWKQIGADFVVDFAANPLVGADGAAANTPGTIGTACPGSVTTYFYTDCLHLTATGQLQLAAAASNSLNYYFGAKLSNPNVVTTTTYQMLSGDGAITAAPTANSAYTMPDCTGPSGATYIISNPQSAFTLSVIGKTNQPINGLTTAITIPSNSTVTMRDVANPKATSGCHWVM